MQFPQRRLNRSRILLFVSGVLLLCIYALSLKSRQPHAPISFNAGADWGGEDDLEVRLREVRASNETELESTKPPLVIIVNRTDLEVCHYVDPRPPRAPPTPPLLTTTAPPQQPLQPPHSKGDYPEDLFSVEQRRQGWVVLHIIGMIYMFVSLAIVCDEFFVPALGVITDKLEISDDVAGATFMAAGGSAPELFTSLIGVFISHSNVGIGTIVGSAVFNILFVIGMCAIFSREMLHLTWWPLFRDINFYILDLIMLIVFFLDNVIWWWESLMLVLGYISYVIFMKFNSQIERTFKNQLNRHRSIVKTWSTTEPEKVRPVLQRGGSSASLHNTSLRSPIFQLMIYTLDPLGEEAALRGAVRTSRPKKATEETSFNGDVKGVRLVKKKAKNKVKPLGVPLTEKQHNKSLYRHVEDTGQKPKSEQSASAGTAGSVAAQPSTSQPPTEENVQKTPDKAEESKAAESEGGSGGSQKSSEEDSGEDESSDSSESKEEDEEDEENKEEEEESEPLTLEWPTTPRKQATYLFLLPIVFPLWLTLPDVRNPASKRFFIATFLGSIFWIGIYSYMMVWWAHQVGETIGISEEIMGLTILAAGTSIPDLITSVIVARKGLGDMAVSSSVGSNIFDITVGLPVPWLIYTALHAGEPVTVSSNGLFCAIVLLFLMLLFVIISIAVCRWKMSKKLGVTMFVLYIVFLVLSVLLENRVLICPISI
ncbi:PREDICTED: sodium/potassium/calcium exchanger 1-like isoform X3 [Cyprinodon variegatus]|uniref:sodium/potassium/calcium exchanger 1-like isoform X3 n=1 Tax=Cyprinodon variegatus TaxID=28743 RepID=UPI000742CD64|nr:PREDICTED: sodium/potassium/calcium exchanger 1-like isoform X3 [Cyprinodon variegatus]